MSRRHRFSVVGTIGSGKTTLAKRISEKLDIPHVELDSLHWGPNWVEAPNLVFRDRVRKALSARSWVTDGNYHQVRDIVWGQADTVVWLDYPFHTVMLRLAMRTMKRVLTREELWNGNVERLRGVFGRDSVFWWATKTYRRRRRDYPLLLSRPENLHLSLVRLRSPRQASVWLSTLL